MRWPLPWPRKKERDTARLMVSWAGQKLAYLQAELAGDGSYVVTRVGVEEQGSDSPQEFQSRLQGLADPNGEVHVMLRPEQYQLLQIDVPPVPPEELRAAARFQIRDMVDTHLDDLTIDVMRLGDGHQKGNSSLYVVVVANALIKEITDLAKALRWPLTVIDIQDTAQRNLQTLQAKTDGTPTAANAALMVVNEHQALLTISAQGELFYSRRLELPDGFLSMDWSESLEIFSDDAPEFVPAPEYVPDYSGEMSFDYSAGAGPSSHSAPLGGQSDRDRAQRLLVEVQRSLDLWDRTWTALPLSGLRVFAGDRSLDLAAWLSQEMGQTVGLLEVPPGMPEMQRLNSGELIDCLPLWGTLQRSLDTSS